MDQPNDLLKARTEAALLLRLDPSNLSPSDTLRCDLIASLRLVVDDASTSVLDGRAPDLARLLTATESLIRLLPSEPPKPESAEHDPREIMWRTYLEMRRRGELAESYLSPQQRLEAARAKVAAIEAEISALAPPPDEPSATPPAPAAPVDNVVQLSLRNDNPRPSAPPPPAAPPKPAPAAAPAATNMVDLRAGYSDGPAEPWREFCTDVDGVPLSGRGKYWGPI
jgi:hypothetical protein